MPILQCFSPSPVALMRCTSLCRKIVIPTLPPSNKNPSGAGHRSSSSSSSSEYHANKNLSPHLAQFLDRDAADSLRRQQELGSFHAATAKAAEDVWRDSKSHLRQQEKLVADFGVEGAVREVLQPTRTSFRQELRQRPLDRGILEEIYKGLHGKRIERRLKRGVSWEHWITKGDGTAPVFTASRKAQQTFAFGGKIRLAARATHAKQFPLLLPGGQHASTTHTVSSSPRRPSSSTSSTTSSSTSTTSKETGPRLSLVPEVAFIGRTSSGKSSLINAIVNAMVAPYGHLQGTTNAVSFYSVADRVVLVDCPGYGYYNPAETPAIDAANAIEAMRDYLTACGSRHGAQRRPIKRVFVCVSARGLQHSDTAYLDRLEELAVPFSVVLTKTDAAPIQFLARLADHTRCQLVRYKHCNELMLASALRLAGIDKLQNLIGSMAIGEDKLNNATDDFSAIV